MSCSLYNTLQFLACDHNRDGDSHRSPWSNMYFPQLEDGFCPSEHLRQLELHANEVFDIYRELYFGKSSSVSSVYLWDKDLEPSNNKGTNNDEATTGFSGAFLIQNKLDNDSYWNSIHVVDVGRIERRGGSSSMCQYKLTTTILISVTPSSSETTEQKECTTRISGSLIRQNVRECKISSTQDSRSSIGSEHIVNIGKFIEDVETEMRKEMDSLYIQKTKNVVEMIRKDIKMPTQGEEHTRVLNEAVLAMAMERKAKLGGK